MGNLFGRWGGFHLEVLSAEGPKRPSIQSSALRTMLSLVKRRNPDDWGQLVLSVSQRNANTINEF